MSNPTVGFAGMTHLGLVSATAVASRGFSTVCFDARAGLIEDIKRGKLPVSEPDLAEMLRANGKRQAFTSTIAELAACDIVYIAADVPTGDHGESDLGGIRDLIDGVTALLGPAALLIVLSQVPPGFTRALASPPLSRRYYQVETLVFGRAVERAAKPERYIVGCADPSEPLDPRFHALLGAFGCPILPMRYESAELAKISINMYLVASVTVANTLAELCEAIGADWSQIVPALKLDRRIGPGAYLAPGLGIAGGNLERDLATVQRLSESFGTEAGIVGAWQRNSRYRRDWALREIQKRTLSQTGNAVVGILGVTYKENTHSIKNSPAVALIEALKGFALRVFDPAVRASKEWHPNLKVTDCELATCDGADTLVLMTPWPQFRTLDPGEIARRLRGRVVIDPFSMLDRAATAAAGLEHVVLGAALPAHRK